MQRLKGFTSFGSHFVFTMFVDIVLVIGVLNEFVRKNIGVVL